MRVKRIGQQWLAASPEKKNCKRYGQKAEQKTHPKSSPMMNLTRTSKN
jgi:hypothetical protein